LSDMTDFDTDMGIICSRKWYWELESCVKERKEGVRKQRKREACFKREVTETKSTIHGSCYLFFYFIK
jgi:hypothetical protein